MILPMDILVGGILRFMDISDLGAVWDAIGADHHLHGWSVACHDIIRRDLLAYVSSHPVDPQFHEFLDFTLYCIVPRMIAHFQPGACTRQKLVVLYRFMADIRSLSIFTQGTRQKLTDTPSWQWTTVLFTMLKTSYPEITTPF